MDRKSERDKGRGESKRRVRESEIGRSQRVKERREEWSVKGELVRATQEGVRERKRQRKRGETKRRVRERR